MTRTPLDFEAIARAIPIASAVAEWLPDGKRQGHEWVARNPMRADTRPGSFSVNLDTGAWGDFATDQRGGDLISLWAYLRHGNDNVAAARDLADRYGVTPATNVRQIDDRKPRVVIPAPADAPRPSFVHPTHGKPSRVWPYYDARGQIMLFVARFDHADGRKDICPLSWCEHPGKPARWTWRGITGTDRRPLYGLDRLAALPDADVLIVEGEKTADAAQDIVGRDPTAPFAVVAWLGGTATADKLDLAPLRGRRVVLWPDFDLQRERLSTAEREASVDPDTKPLLPFDRQPGSAAMLTIAQALARHAASLTLVAYDPTAPRFPGGWDIADAKGWTVDNIRGFVAMHGRDPREQAGNDNPPPPPAGEATPPDEPPAPRTVPLDHDLNPYGFPRCSDKGRPLNVIENLRHLLTEYGITARYNVMNRDLLVDIPGVTFADDNRLNNALTFLKSLCARNSVPSADLVDYISLIADANPVNPPAEWITSRPWDGVDRLEPLARTLDPHDLDLAVILLRRWMIGAVSCAMSDTGTAMQGVLVLQGPQNAGKTSWLWTLAGGKDRRLMLEGAQLNPDDKDSVKRVISHWIVELGELDATFRKADISALKAFVTKDRDDLRLPFARAASTFPRRTALSGTVNEDAYLRDETGNRRYWTIACGPGITSRHSVDVQQVWAQAVALYRQGEPHPLQRDELARLNAANEDFTERGPIEELLHSRFDWASPWRGLPMTATDALIAVGFDKPNRQQSREAGIVLRKLTEGPPRKTNGKQVFEMPARVERAS